MRIGIGIGAAQVRMLIVRKGRVLWAGQREYDSSQSVGAALGDLLNEAPLRRWPRGEAVVAVGPSFAQVRRLSGLPPLDDHGELAQLVSESAGRFFLRNGVPLITTGVRVEAPGVAWAGALDEPVLESIYMALRHAPVRIRGYVPAAVAVGLGIEGNRALWKDGDILLDAAYNNGCLTSVRRMRDTDPKADFTYTAPPAPALAVIGTDAFRFSDAYGAASICRKDPLIVLPKEHIAGSSGSFLRIAAMILLVSTLLITIGPPIQGWWVERTANERLGMIAGYSPEILPLSRILPPVTAALDDVSAFDTSRYMMIRLLGDIATVLPDESALVSLQIDGEKGGLVALASSGSAVITALEQVVGMTDVKLLGPIARQVSDDRILERITLEFRIDGALRRRHDSKAAAP